MWFHALEMEFSHYWDWDFSNSLTQILLGMGYCMTETGILQNLGLGNGIRTPSSGPSHDIVYQVWRKSIDRKLLSCEIGPKTGP